VIGHEQRGAQRLQYGLLADVGIGVVDEHAGVHIAVGVDVEVAAAAGYAAADILRVVLEVHGEQGLRLR
jgi:hypothetical protein